MFCILYLYLFVLEHNQIVQLQLGSAVDDKSQSKELKRTPSSDNPTANRLSEMTAALKETRAGSKNAPLLKQGSKVSASGEASTQTGK